MVKNFLNAILKLIPISVFGIFSITYIMNGYLGYLVHLGILCTIILIINVLYKVRKKETVKRINIIIIIVIFFLFGIFTIRNWEIIRTKYFCDTIGSFYGIDIKLREIHDDGRAEICYWNRKTNYLHLKHHTFPNENWIATVGGSTSEPNIVTLLVKEKNNWKKLGIEKILFGLPSNSTNITDIDLYIKFKNANFTYIYAVPPSISEDIYYQWAEQNRITQTEDFLGYSIEYDQLKYAIEDQTHIYDDYAGNECAEQSFNNVRKKDDTFETYNSYNYKTIFWKNLDIYSSGWNTFKKNNPDNFTDKANNFEEYWKLRTTEEVINVYPNIFKDSSKNIANYIKIDIDENTGTGEIKILYTQSGTLSNGNNYKYLVGIYRKIENSKQYWGVYKSNHTGYITLKEESGDIDSETYKDFETLVQGWKYNR